MAYRPTEKRDRWKAMGAATAVTALLGTLILTGLDVDIVARAADRLRTFEIALPKPPQEPPPEVRSEDAAPEDAGAPGKTAEATPVVAPPPEILLPPRETIATATEPGTGAAASSGAGIGGTGTGAGGSGGGSGGGGSGDFSKFTPARLIRNLTRGDYRGLAAGRLATGRAMVSLKVEPDGSPANCRVVRSSGDATVDSGLCPLITRRLRFRPALDDRGRPVPYQLDYVATWRL